METAAKVKARLSTLGAKDIALIAVFSGLVFVLTMFAIPMPAGGFWHFGNAMIILSGLMFGGLVGGLCGTIGATLADLVLGYGMWAPWTFFIKFFVGLLPGIISDGKSVPKTVIGIVAGWLVNYVLYTFAYMVLLGWPSAVQWLAADLVTIAYTIGAPLIVWLALRRGFPRIFDYRESVKSTLDIYFQRKNDALKPE
ncbi:MAG: ECF transporter S component [Desulfobacteraceae bacterium]|nr:MAG: ECF transporter S component [Desulfobacteraceae bacterium]